MISDTDRDFADGWKIRCESNRDRKETDWAHAAPRDRSVGKGAGNGVGGALIASQKLTRLVVLLERLFCRQVYFIIFRWVGIPASHGTMALSSSTWLWSQRHVFLDLFDYFARRGYMVGSFLLK